MSDLAGRFVSKRQTWATPDEIFDPLNEEFRFTLDAAASEDNAKCPKFLTDALSCDWGREVVWLNPPYGNKVGTLAQWVRKALEQSRKGSTVVMLIPARTNTNWFHDLCMKHGEIRFVRGRPKFGDAVHGLPQPLCVVIFKADAEKMAA